MIWRWLRALWCAHDTTIRHRDQAGGYWLRCDRCGAMSRVERVTFRKAKS